MLFCIDGTSKRYRAIKVLFYLLVILFAVVYSKILQRECLFDAKLSLVTNDGRGTGAVIVNVTVEDVYECIAKCATTNGCESINHQSSNKICEVLSNTTFDEGIDLRHENGWTHYETDHKEKEVGPTCEQLSPCPSHLCEDTCTNPGYKCDCRKHFTGMNCKQYNGVGSEECKPAKSCKWLKEKEDALQSGNYWINLTQPSYVHCDMEAIEDAGRKQNMPGQSCKWLKELDHTRQSGYYWINLTIPTLVYCDMDTLLGGWTMIGNVTSQSYATPSYYAYKARMVNNLSSLAEVKTGEYLLNGDSFNTLHGFLDFNQLRIFCHKSGHGRTFHITTLERSSMLIKYFTGEMNQCPSACNSFDVLPDDTSYLSTMCRNWGNGKDVWGCPYGSSPGPVSSRLYDHSAYVKGKAHVQLNGARLECDDHDIGSGYSYLGTWQYFVR